MATPSHSTPIAPTASLAIKVCSTRFSNSNGCISVKTLDSLLAKELTGGMVRKTSTHIDFTLNEYIPFTVDNNLLQSLTAVYANNAWISRPTGVGQESEVAEWMNNIGDDLARKLPNGPRLLRKWSAQNANTSLAGSSVERKPDIILVDHDSASPYFWQNVRGLTEVTSQPTFHARIRNTIYQKSFLMFTSQPDRRIVLSLALFGKGFVFTACDRAGVIHSETLSYNECALTLLSLLAIFMFGTEESIGYDTTMRRGPDDNIKAITVAGDDYTVLRKIYSAETLRGRATQCWHVKKDGQEFAIKDSWVHLGRSSNEINILKKIEGVRDTPALHVGEDVKLSSGKVDSTALLRQGHDYKEHRCHRRLVMTPVGAPIFTFTSRKELIGAFRNIVQGVFIHSVTFTVKQLMIFIISSPQDFM